MNKDYVWYACYGSNLSNNRFYTYLQGGKIALSSKSERGARDASLPLKEEIVNINYRLFFADRSERWYHGGVAYINPIYDVKEKTMGKMYLITKEQFIDVVKQENDLGMDTDFNEDFYNLKKYDTVILFPDKRYGRIICLGEYEGYKIFTFTCIDTMDKMDLNRPSSSYIDTIADGIVSTYNIKLQKALEYLYEKYR